MLNILHRIYFVGMPFIILYNFGAAVLRAIGDTRRPLYCLIVSGVLNVVLNLFFVCVCKLGVAGVGMATVISNVVSTGIVMYILMHEEGPLRLDIKNIRSVPGKNTQDRSSISDTDGSFLIVKCADTGRNQQLWS